MLMYLKKQITHFLKWRYRHISDKNFTLIMSVLVGFIAGLLAVFLKNATHFIELLLQRDHIIFSQSSYFIFPVIGLFLVYILNTYVFHRFPSQAVPTILHSLSRRSGIIKTVKIYYPLIVAPLTVGFGGSTGLLGPAIMSGASISSSLSTLFHIDNKTRTLLFGCTASAAIAAVFHSPIAGIVFAVEVLSLDLTLSSLLPLLLASLSGVITSYLFLGEEVLFRFTVSEVFELKDIPFYILLGVGTAFASVYFTKMYFKINVLFNKIDSHLKRLLFGSMVIGTVLFFIPALYGEGFSFINNLLVGNYVEAIGNTYFNYTKDNIWGILLLLVGITFFKTVAMTMTLTSGGAGGIIIPTLVVGSAIGNIVAQTINQLGFNFKVSESNFTLVGMAGLIAGVLHAPLTAIFLIAEVSGGYQLFIPLMFTVAFSYIITRHFIAHSIYTQELAKKGQLITHDKDEMVLMLMKLDTVIEDNFVQVKSTQSLRVLLLNAVAKSSRNMFPVVNEADELLGVVYLDDIRDIMFDQSMYDKVSVHELMKQVPEIIIYEKDSMKTVMKKFQDSSAWNLPVVKEGKYYGFISKSKMLTSYRRKLINSTR